MRRARRRAVRRIVGQNLTEAGAALAGQVDRGRRRRIICDGEIDLIPRADAEEVEHVIVVRAVAWIHRPAIAAIPAELKSC